MLVEHTLIPEDVIAFSKYHQQRMRELSPRQSYHMLITCLIVGAFSILLVADVLQNASEVFIYVLLFLMAVGVLLYFLSRASMPWSEGRLRRMMMTKEGEKTLGQRRLLLTPTHLQLESEEEKDEYAWSQVTDIGVTEEHAFIYLDNEAVLIIPSRAFSNDWQFQEFVTKVREYQNVNQL